MTATSREELEQKTNVRGTYISHDDDGNEIVVALVTKKVPESALDDDDIVDKTVELDGRSYATDVEEAHIPHLQTRNQTERRPVPGGMSIGTDDGGAGTLGSPLLETEEGWTVQLTNRHVATEGEQVYQPALMDDGTTDDEIGTVLEHSPFDESGTNTCDSALVAVNPGVADREVLGIGPVAGFREAEYGTHLKSGRTTGLTTGRLRGRDGRVRVAYGDKTLLFEGLDIYDGMSAAGDSGSLIGCVKRGEFYATSLLFAGSDRITLGIPMSTVMDVHGELTICSEDHEACEPASAATGTAEDGGVPWWHTRLTALASGVTSWLLRVFRALV